MTNWEQMSFDIGAITDETAGAPSWPSVHNGRMPTFSLDERRAAARAQWLGDLSETLAQASRLVLKAAEGDPERSDLTQLRVQIRNVRAEIDRLQRGQERPTPVAFDRLA